MIIPQLLFFVENERESVLFLICLQPRPSRIHGGAPHAPGDGRGPPRVLPNLRARAPSEKNPHHLIYQIQYYRISFRERPLGSRRASRCWEGSTMTRDTRFFFKKNIYFPFEFCVNDLFFLSPSWSEGATGPTAPSPSGTSARTTPGIIPSPSQTSKFLFLYRKKV